MDLLNNRTESRNQSLCEPEAENELGASHEQFRSKALEEGCETLVFGHVGDDAETGLLGLEVLVLNTSLDNIERSGDDERGGGTADGGNEVLTPAGRVVIVQLVDILLGESRTTEELGGLSTSASRPRHI